MKKILLILFIIPVLIYANCNLSVSLNYKPYLCYGTLGDTITTVVANGTLPYTYHWSDNSAGATNIVYGGQHTVTVTDKNNCTVINSATIHQDAQVHYSDIIQLHLCVHPTYANLNIAGEGGTGIFNYFIAGIDTNTTGIFDSLPANDYVFIIVDSVGCSTQGRVIVPTPTPDTYQITIDSVRCAGGSDGVITIGWAGTNSPYQFNLDSGAYQSNNTFNNVSEGAHIISARNGNGCITDIPVNVPSSQQICTGVSDLELVNEIVLYPNPTKGVFTIHSGTPVITMDVYDELGRKVEEQKATSTEIHLPVALENGIYFVHFVTNEGMLVKKIVLER